jgi:hypothetical protein
MSRIFRVDVDPVLFSQMLSVVSGGWAAFQDSDREFVIKKAKKVCRFLSALSGLPGFGHAAQFATAEDRKAAESITACATACCDEEQASAVRSCLSRLLA